MNRVERHIVFKDKSLDNICFLSKNLYNYANYLVRQSFIEDGELLNEYGLIKNLTKENQIDYRSLPIQTSQQVIKVLFKNWKSFFKANKEYKKNKAKFLGRPKMPKYKDKNGKNIVIFTNQQVKVKDGIINFPKKTNITPIRTKVLNKNLREVRIIPQAVCYIIEVVYKKEIKEIKELKKENILSIDLGLDNFATCINNVGNNPFIINGKPLKSINQYFNKENAKLQAFVGDKGTSRKIKRLVFRRNNKITNYIHHCSKFVINYCISNNIGTIIIGNNKNWKIESKMSKKVNQQFIQIPFSTFINQIKHKAEENGINVILTEESYTSKIDHLALEPLEKQDTYLGKRVKRGLFQSSTGKLINADINGAIGIARKVIGDSYVNEIINRGLVFNPIRINVITNFNKGGC